MRILVTCDWFSPTTGGGAERVAFEVSRRLAATGHAVTILATTPSRGTTFSVPPEIRLVTVPAYDLSRAVRAQVSVSPSLLRVTGRLIDSSRPDVVWAHSLQFQTTIVAAASAHRHGIPLVVSAHIADLKAVKGLVGVAARVHEATVGRAILRVTRRVIAVSQPVAVHVRSLAPRVPVDVVPNGVDLERFHAVDRSRHAELRIGFMGRLVSNKGPDVAIRAVGSLVNAGRDARLFIAGAGPEEASLRRLAESLNVRDRVLFEGHRPDAAAWLGGIDVVVRPSLTEGMPLGILEAMASGVPVVASDIPGNASILLPTGAGILVRSGDHEALAAALARLHDDVELQADLRIRGHDVASRATWDRTTTLTIAVLGRAAGAPAVGPEAAPDR